MMAYSKMKPNKFCETWQDVEASHKKNVTYGTQISTINLKFSLAKSEG